VARALKQAKGGDQKLLGVGGASLERSIAANRALVGAPCLPAWRRYTGVVWDHLDIAGLDPAARARASDAVVVISAVHGLVGLDDPMPDHRLKLSVGLGALGGLAAFWRRPLSGVLNEHLAGRLVVDLLPGEHAGAWVPAPERYDLRRVRLVRADGRAVGHDAKAAKGRLARALLEAAEPEDVLAGWTHEEYGLDITTA
jgi:cytoplasmic iron level regulating protein YaaA (DUF328/UPF0246 family)